MAARSQFPGRARVIQTDTSTHLHDFAYHLFEPMWWRRIYTPGIDIQVRCTQREAALLRNEIRRRIQAARIG